MTVLLGGRVAEQIVFGEVTTGASDDLQRVAKVAHAMVYEYAMGTASTEQRAIPQDNEQSEAFRRRQDEQQPDLAFEAHRAALELLSSHRDKLEEFARTLLEREVLERADIDVMMAGVPRLERPQLAPGPAHGVLAGARARRRGIAASGARTRRSI